MFDLYRDRTGLVGTLVPLTVRGLVDTQLYALVAEVAAETTRVRPRMVQSMEVGMADSR